MKALIVVFVLISGFAFSQNPSERTVYSFRTKAGENIVVSHDTLTNVLIYRSWKRGILELEITDNLNDTVEVFSYTSYFRPGGKENDGLDLRSFHFDNEDFHYKIYYAYSATEESTSVGIFITNKTTGQTYDLKGVAESIRGSLSEFKDNGLVPVSDE